MGIKAKILNWISIQDQTDEEYYRDNPDEDREFSIHALRALGPPRLPPIRLPVWNSDETVAASPMLEEWFSFANGWNEYKLCRRALSVEEMKDPRLGIDFYLADPEIYDEDDRVDYMKFLINDQIPGAINDELVNMGQEGSPFRLINPKFVLFSLPTNSSVTGPEFLLFDDSLPGPEPMVLTNDFACINLGEMLDKLIELNSVSA